MGDVENENPSGGTVKDTAETNTATVAAEAMNAVKDEFRTPIIPASAKDTGLNPDISSDSVDKNTAPCDNVNEFRSPASPASISKKQAGKPVTMTIKSRYAIPADIYKAPKVAVFIADFPSKRTNGRHFIWFVLAGAVSCLCAFYQTTPGNLTIRVCSGFKKRQF